MAAAAGSATGPGERGSGQIPFDPSRPPDIEGFIPLSRAREESFQEKFIRKTKENPFVPIGELHNSLTQPLANSIITLLFYSSHNATRCLAPGGFIYPLSLFKALLFCCGFALDLCDL